ncbi:unnamed protein product [Cylicocyclus nassatus]|uniref:Uncharacterized protein n=1 Tax=Cylicocyclus nassatus TaxID=53992 RepID=A0AA36DVC5_CYLNA|nr:unnamed protein product [Cylicocyclus nassatus]
MYLRMWLCLLLISCLGTDAGKRKGKKTAHSTRPPYMVDSLLPNEDDKDDDAKIGTSISDFFPYIIPKKTKLLRLQPLATMYYKPGYATFYRKFYADFAILVHPPMDCLAVYICFMRQTNATKSGLSRIDIESACKDSIRISTMEQILYHVKEGKAKPYVLLKAELDFRQKKGNPDVYELQVWTDFDHEDVSDAKQVTIEVPGKKRDILLLTSSPYCHAVLFNDDGAVPGSIIQIESNTDASQFYRIMGRAQYFPHILSRTAENSRSKTLKSEIVININKAATSQAECCPKLNEFTGYLNDDEWQEISVRPIANEYTLAKVGSLTFRINFSIIISFRNIVKRLDHSYLEQIQNIKSRKKVADA